MTEIIQTDQIWEDKEGYQWKVMNSSFDNGISCTCVLKPKKRGLVGRYKVGDTVVWENEGKESFIFHKLIRNSMGELVHQKEVEKITLKSKDNSREPADETYESDVYMTEAQSKSGEGQETKPQTMDPDSIDYLLYSISQLGEEFEDRKLALNDFTKARLTKEELKKSMTRALSLVDGINLGNAVKKSSLITKADLADINKGIKTKKLKENDENIVEEGQIWENSFTPGLKQGDKIKIIGVIGDDVFALRIQTSDGKAPTYSMASKLTKVRLSGYYFLTSEFSEVTIKEISQFSALNAIRESKINAEIAKTNGEDPLIKRLNSSYSETFHDLKKLIKVRFKLFENI